MQIVLINAAGTRTEHGFDTLEKAHGAIGSKCPLILDGKGGHLEFASSDSPAVRFVETDGILKHFAYTHLPEHLQAVSKPFGEMAERLFFTLPRDPERTVALRKLLESKDAAVRAALAR